MPPISESNRYTTTDLKLSQCDCEADKKKKVNNAGSTTDHTTTIKKSARDGNEIRSLKTTEPINDQGKQVKSASELNKNHLKGSKFDDFVEKLNKAIKNEFIQRQPELQQSDDLEDEKATGHLDTKAAAELDIPTELESVYVWKEGVQGVTKYSEDGETAREEGDSGDKLDEHDESVTSKSACAQPQETHRSHASGEDSEIPVGEPTDESGTSEIDKATFVVTVSKTHFKPYGPMDLATDEIKFSEQNTTSLSQIVLPNDSLLEQLSNEEQTQNVNISSAFVVNQLLKHLENEVSTQDISDAPTLITAEKLQVGTSVYPYFTALAGPAGESPEGLSNDNSEPQDCGEDDDDIVTFEGPVSDCSFFQSDFADAYNPDT